jgi:hypothetical protein
LTGERFAQEVEIKFPERDSKHRAAVRDAVLFWGR